MLEVREDRFAGPPGGGFGGRGGFGGGMRGGFRGGFGARGGFGGGYGGRGGHGGGGYGGPPAGGSFDGAAPAVGAAPPNPFTDYASSGGEPSELIYVRNVSFLSLGVLITLLTSTVALVHKQRRSSGAFYYYWNGRTCRDPIRT